MGRLLPLDPRPSRADPEARSARKEIEKSSTGFSWTTAAILGVLGVTMLINVEKGVERCEKRHQRKGDWDRCRNGRDRGSGGDAGDRGRDRGRDRTRASTETPTRRTWISSPRRDRSYSRRRSKSAVFDESSESGPKQKLRRDGRDGSPTRERGRSSTRGGDKSSQGRSSRRSES
ncbi:hypothetical protein MCOR25_009967 [Pyricularia grisea]|uniref:Uncharacterized protein n=1 Tax=Pyricularia grisea TaxID=148305 RepID=A0A6P8BI66_PYRGI|nr:uncharacterized protein PgNI_01726 [Pyricularia grisea]KAI6351379.1 hypothetical protein MCOR25_009967 [Pyricularia grisea]TLD16317.1 hypothetical protein PgNI_01726 [Pyricularia grisea]